MLQGREALGERRGRVALDLYAGAVFFFLILPTFVVVPISLSAGDFLAFPPPGWSLKWYISYFNQPAWLYATLLSFQVAVVTTLVSTVLGTLAAFGVLRGRLRRRTLVVSLIISPIIVPPIVIGVAIYGLLAQWDLIGRFLGLVIGHAAAARRRDARHGRRVVRERHRARALRAHRRREHQLRRAAARLVTPSTAAR